MTVIASATLHCRRLRELLRKRSELQAEQDRLRRALPDWTVTPLMLVGMCEHELRGMVSDLSRAEHEAGLDALERELDVIENEIERIEDQLLGARCDRLETVSDVLDVAIERFRRHVSSDPDDVFYDYGDNRTLAMLERASEDLRSLIARDHRIAV